MTPSSIVPVFGDSRFLMGRNKLKFNSHRIEWSLDYYQTPGSTESLVLNGDHTDPFERGAQFQDLRFTAHGCGQEGIIMWTGRLLRQMHIVWLFSSCWRNRGRKKSSLRSKQH